MDDLISCYSRSQAIEDGVLVDVSEVAREAGFTYPSAVTRTVWESCIAVGPRDKGQDERGRLWDVLWMLRWQVNNEPNINPLYFEVLISKDGQTPKPIRLKAHCGPGDTPSPVITLMMPDED